MVTPAAERKAVAHLAVDHGMSEWRACKAIGCCRMTVRYHHRRADHRDFERAEGWRVSRRSVPQAGVSDASIYKWKAKFGGSLGGYRADITEAQLRGAPTLVGEEEDEYAMQHDVQRERERALYDYWRAPIYWSGY